MASTTTLEGGEGHERRDTRIEKMYRDKQERIAGQVALRKALIRLSDSSAKLRLSNVVNRENAELVVRLVLKSFEKIDIDYLTDTPKAERDKIAVILHIVENLENLTMKGAPEDEIIKAAEEKGIDAERTRTILRKLKERGNVFCPKVGYYRVVRLG